jgi:hypothetical protein
MKTFGRRAEMIPHDEAYVTFMARHKRACEQSRHLIWRARVLVADMRAQRATRLTPYQHTDAGLTVAQEQLVITQEVLRTTRALLRTAEAEMEATMSELAMMNTEWVSRHRQPPQNGGRTAVEIP